MINVYDNVISKEKNDEWYHSILYKGNYNYGESDRPGMPPTGMTLEIKNAERINELSDIAFKYHPELNDLKFLRAYVNLFFPHDRPAFHPDLNCYTCLFYITPEYDMQEGGETQFLKNDEYDFVGVFPKPGRLIVFDGDIYHRATSYRNNPRITIALKFIKP